MCAWYSLSSQMKQDSPNWVMRKLCAPSLYCSTTERTYFSCSEGHFLGQDLLSLKSKASPQPFPPVVPIRLPKLQRRALRGQGLLQYSGHCCQISTSSMSHVAEKDMVRLMKEVAEQGKWLRY